MRCSLCIWVWIITDTEVHLKIVPVYIMFSTHPPDYSFYCKMISVDLWKISELNSTYLLGLLNSLDYTTYSHIPNIRNFKFCFDNSKNGMKIFQTHGRVDKSTLCTFMALTTIKKNCFLVRTQLSDFIFRLTQYTNRDIRWLSQPLRIVMVRMRSSLFTVDLL